MDKIGSSAMENNANLIFSLEVAFSKGTFLNILSEMGERGIEAYKTILVYDTFYPLVYSFTLCSFISFLSNKSSGNNFSYSKYIFFFPPVAAIFDYIENTFHFYLLSDPINISENIFFISAFSSSIKWVLIFLSFLYIFFDLFRIIKRNLQQKNLQG